jgi:ectoine hydroxylase-related dioxygenase (phytanoyl-CoA dioxygenase family)
MKAYYGQILLTLVASNLDGIPNTDAALVVPRRTRRRSTLLCGRKQGPSAPSPTVWTSRRGMLQQSTVATATALIPWLPQMAEASTSASADWMADPGPAYSTGTAARRLLQAQADTAAQAVTEAHIREYQSMGVTKVRQVVSNEWLALLREGCEVAQDEAGPYAEYLQQPTDAGIFFTDLEMARRLPLFAAFSLHGPAAAVAGTILGSQSIRYLYDQLFVKEAGVSTWTPWHQDGGYWRVKGSQVASVFVPLDPVAPQDGLSFVKGSHRWDLYNPQHFADGTQYVGTALPPMPNVSQLTKDGTLELATFALEPGDVLVFSARTVHGGPGNWGRALSTRWVGDDGRFWDRPGEGAIPTIKVQLQDGDLLASQTAAFPTSWTRRESKV